MARGFSTAVVVSGPEWDSERTYFSGESGRVYWKKNWRTQRWHIFRDSECMARTRHWFVAEAYARMLRGKLVCG